MAQNIVEKAKEKYIEFDNRHQKILNGAISVFNKKGYAGATTAEIAKEAGVVEPTMYKHFKNKKVLYLSCFQSIVDELMGAYREVYKQNQDDDEAGHIKGIIKTYLDFVDNNPNKSMFLVHLLSYRAEPEFEKAFTEFMEASISAIERIIVSARKKGKVKSRIDDRMLAAMFITQYFTVVALNEIMAPKSLTADIFITIVENILEMDKE